MPLSPLFAPKSSHGLHGRRRPTVNRVVDASSDHPVPSLGTTRTPVRPTAPGRTGSRVPRSPCCPTVTGGRPPTDVQRASLVVEILVRRRLAGRTVDRQADLERRPARTGVDADVAVVLLDDDAPGDVQAQPGALADVLGGEERLEDARAHVLGDARTAVGDLDDGVAAVAARADRQRPRAVTGRLHGADGV